MTLEIDCITLLLSEFYGKASTLRPRPQTEKGRVEGEKTYRNTPQPSIQLRKRPNLRCERLPIRIAQVPHCECSLETQRGVCQCRDDVPHNRHQEVRVGA
jgi:hypothetical protein